MCCRKRAALQRGAERTARRAGRARTPPLLGAGGARGHERLGDHRPDAAPALARLLQQGALSPGQVRAFYDFAILELLIFRCFCSCQFIVLDADDAYQTHVRDPDLLVDWDKIQELVRRLYVDGLL